MRIKDIDPDELKSDILTMKISALAKKYGVTRQTIYRWIEDTSLATQRTSVIVENMALIGTMPDNDVAEMLGVKPNSVTVYRTRHGIPNFIGSPEATLQASFCKTLPACRQYVSTPYGIIDVIDDSAIYECKTSLTLSAAHRSVGQLLLYQFAYPDRAIAIVCGRIDVGDHVVDAIKSLGISIIVHSP
jgi:hypothetical protein